MIETKRKLLLELAASKPLNASTCLLTFRIESDVAASCRPGQFFNFRPLDSTAPLLRRPISICDARPDAAHSDAGEIDFLVKIVGEGTRLLAVQAPGTTVDVVGPLGNPFTPDPTRPSLLIAGGVGVAPLHFLARSLPAHGGGDAPITFCYGARTQRDFVLLDRIERATSDLILATEDGSLGHKGLVTEIAEPFLADGTQIFVCGPSPMMNAMLPLLRERGLTAQLSLENQMGCGVGACQGCVVPGRQGHIRVCCDGPVVSSEDLESVFSD
ncbi:dihydroorotate dehydrogenase electron transfer subunit [Candidatus Sumerlaeota bacterium]|nr:dihydroorotate dehydrogenase electron transfer subunit [Candidatus Sumerlaeota bacterium]